MSLWTDFLGAERTWVEVDGVPTRVVSAGRGDSTLVLLHGRGGHLESWRANLLALAQAHHVVAFDLLGHGLTGRHEGDYGVDDLVRHAAATLDALSVTDAVIVGQSLGGWVAVHVALRRPDLVARLVLIEPAGMQSTAEQLSDPKFAAQFERGGRAFSEPTREAVRDRLTGLVSDPADIDDELVETRRLLYAPAAAREVHRKVRAADNGDALLTANRMGRLRVRTLVIHGEASHTPLDAIERALGRVGRSTVTTVSGARQWPQLERPDVVNALVTDFANEGER